MHCGQERLDLLLRWCQLINLSPFRMERNAETGRFLRFRFSWRHPLTYWWLTCKVVYVAALSLLNAIEIKSFTTPDGSTTSRLTYTVIMMLLFFSNLLLPELLALNCSLHSEASRLLEEFDGMIEKLDGPKCSTRYRTVIGVISVVCVVNKKKDYGKEKITMNLFSSFLGLHVSSDSNFLHKKALGRTWFQCSTSSHCHQIID